MTEEITRYRRNVSSLEACPSNQEIFGKANGVYAREIAFLDGTCVYKIVQVQQPIPFLRFRSPLAS